MGIVSSVEKKNLCIGCGYCSALAGAGTVLSASGFLHPEAATDTGLTPLQQDLVRAACPGINADTVVTEGRAPEGGADDYMWGRHYRVVTAWSTDADVRHAGSSGGVLTALALWLVSSGRVNSVLVTDYDPGYPIGTTSKADADVTAILSSAGSKYCPASPLVALKSLQDMPGKHAVIGRPCDIATLRRAMKAGDPIADKVEVLLSFFCAGTPSDTGNRALLQKLNIDSPDQVIRFRHRGNGWPGDTRADLKDGSAATCTYNESWGHILRRHVHTLCKICPDGIGEQADIVAADAWYGDSDGYPTFDEAAGRSLVISRTPKGRDILDAAMTEGALASEALDVREIDRMQPGQINRRKQLALRLAAYRLVGHAVPRYNAAALRGYQSGMSMMTRAKVFAASLRRLLKLKMANRRG